MHGLHLPAAAASAVRDEHGHAASGVALRHLQPATAATVRYLRVG